MAMTLGLFAWIFWAWNMSLPSIPKITVSGGNKAQTAKAKPARKAKVVYEEEEEDYEEEIEDVEETLTDKA